MLHKGVDMCLRTGNNMGIPEDDYVTLLEELGEELAEECCPGFVTPVEKVGADYLHFQNSKEAYAEPDDMKWWWKIFHAAKADWTTSSKNWESVDWGIFTANMEASKEIARRKVENMKRLQAKTFILPDCGGASYGTRLNLEKSLQARVRPGDRPQLRLLLRRAARVAGGRPHQGGQIGARRPHRHLARLL